MDLDDNIFNQAFVLVPSTNLIIKAGQVIGALVIMEAFSPRANAQSVTSVTSPDHHNFVWELVTLPAAVKF